MLLVPYGTPASNTNLMIRVDQVVCFLVLLFLFSSRITYCTCERFRHVPSWKRDIFNPFYFGAVNRDLVRRFPKIWSELVAPLPPPIFEVVLQPPQRQH